MANSIVAGNAYQSALALAKRITSDRSTTSGMPEGETGGAKATDFSEMVGSAVEGLSEQGKRTDKVMMNHLNGQTGVVDVVTAIAETEIALETAISVRDRVISAYQEVMRMPI